VTRGGEIETIARGIIIKHGRLLLAHTKGASNTYLPGGHIEWGESAREALRRELAEETGFRLRVGGFLGSIEHAFGKGNRRICEINMFFRVGGSRLPERLISREKKLEFLWQPLSSLKAVNLQPHPLQTLVPQLLQSKRPFWASTIE